MPLPAGRPLADAVERRRAPCSASCILPRSLPFHACVARPYSLVFMVIGCSNEIPTQPTQPGRLCHTILGRTCLLVTPKLGFTAVFVRLRSDFVQMTRWHIIGENNAIPLLPWSLPFPCLCGTAALGCVLILLPPTAICNLLALRPTLFSPDSGGRIQFFVPDCPRAV
jgi:hypothetical protein